MTISGLERGTNDRTAELGGDLLAHGGYVQAGIHRRRMWLRSGMLWPPCRRSAHDTVDVGRVELVENVDLVFFKSKTEKAQSLCRAPYVPLGSKLSMSMALPAPAFSDPPDKAEIPPSRSLSPGRGIGFTQ